MWPSRSQEQLGSTGWEGALGKSSAHAALGKPPFMLGVDFPGCFGVLHTPARKPNKLISSLEGTLLENNLIC